MTDTDLAEPVNGPDRHEISVNGQVWKILEQARFSDPASAVLLEVWFVESGDVAFVFFADEASAEGLDLWMSE